MKIENYHFVNDKKTPVTDPQKAISKGEKICLIGKVYGRQGFKDGATVMTSYLTNLDDEVAVTYSGSMYELGTMNADYAEMLQAIERGIPIVFNWNIVRETLMNELPDLKNLQLLDLVGAETHEGIILYGKDRDGKSITGEVKSQNGNLVTLLCVDSIEPSTEKEVECFVVWPSIAERAEFEISMFGRLAGIPYSIFETAFSFKCRPVFPAA